MMALTDESDGVGARHPKSPITVSLSGKVAVLCDDPGLRVVESAWGVELFVAHISAYLCIHTSLRDIKMIQIIHYISARSTFFQPESNVNMLWLVYMNKMRRFEIQSHRRGQNKERKQNFVSESRKRRQLKESHEEHLVRIQKCKMQ